jgi:predicted nucleotidyltransferase
MVCKLPEQGERDVPATLKSDYQEILEILGANGATIKSFGVRSLSLFGSSARNEHTSQSDLDFVVEFEKKSFDSYMDLKFFLEELFERRVDLVLADGIKPRLRAVILKEAVHAPGF